MRRFDLDGDAKMSFTEFAEALTPIQPDVIQNPFMHISPKNENRMEKTLNTIQDNLREEVMSPARSQYQESMHQTINENDMKRSL